MKIIKRNVALCPSAGVFIYPNKIAAQTSDLKFQEDTNSRIGFSSKSNAFVGKNLRAF